MVPWILKIDSGFSVRRGAKETEQRGEQKSCRLGLLSHIWELKTSQLQREDTEEFLNKNGLCP